LGPDSEDYENVDSYEDEDIAPNEEYDHLGEERATDEAEAYAEAEEERLCE
jgi:hypothetical protein